MPERKSKLDRLQIPKPCPVEWNRMTGNEQVRHCQQCDRQVYNLSKMTRNQAEAIISASRGRLCAQFTRRADGTVITEEMSPALHLISRRTSPVAAAIVTAILGISGSASALTVPQAASFISSSDEAGAKKPESQPQAETAVQNEQIVDINANTVIEQGWGGAVMIPIEPLRILYHHSELIVVAHAGASVEVEADEYSVTMKTAIQISSTVKGKSKKPVVYVYHRVPRGSESPFSEGESLLLFLNRREPGAGRKAADGYKIDDERYGLKKLPAAAQAVYVQRMKELELIGKDVRDDNAADLVEWLVSCAVDPATRWEGAYELAQSVRTLEYEKAEELETEEAEETGITKRRNPRREPDLGALVTGEQKHRLMKALFEIDAPGEGDYHLIELARMWKEEGLVPYLVSQLRRLEADPTPFAATLLSELGQFFEDEELISLVNEYEEKASFPEFEDEQAESQEAGSPMSREMKIELARRMRSAKVKEFLDAVEKRIVRVNSKASPD